MALLTDGDLVEIGRVLRSKYSVDLTEMPFTKGQLLVFGQIVDGLLDVLEVDSVTAIPPGDLRQWAIDHPQVVRDIIIEVEKERKRIL